MTERAQRGDATVADADVGADGRRTGAIQHPAATEHDIEQFCSFCLTSLLPGKSYR